MSLELSKRAHPKGLPANPPGTQIPESEYRKPELAARFTQGLNAPQEAAVSGDCRNRLVLSGAGTGKTTVLTSRTAWLCAQGEAPWKITAVTFTNKAASEMRERLTTMLGGRVAGHLRIGTFHQMCLKIVRENVAYLQELRPAFSILDPDGQSKTLREYSARLEQTREERWKAEILNQMSQDPETANLTTAARSAHLKHALAERKKALRELLASGGDFQPEDLILKRTVVSDFVSACKEFRVDPRHEAWLEHPDGRSVLARLGWKDNHPGLSQAIGAYAHYEDSKQQGNYLDFQDILTNALRLLQEQRHVRESCMASIQHLLIDEFQDTNPLQFEIVQWLTRDHQWLQDHPGERPTSVVAVGDDDQSIYAFRLASPDILPAFEAGFNAAVVKLEQNYRSLSPILDAANGVIQNNSQRMQKRLFTTSPLPDDHDGKVHLNVYAHQYDEARGIAEQVSGLLRKGVAPSEIAILYRTNLQATPLEAELTRQNIRFTTYGGYRYFDRQEIKAVLNYMDLAVECSRDLLVKQVINLPLRKGVGAGEVQRIADLARAQDRPMVEVLCELHDQYHAYRSQEAEVQRLESGNGGLGEMPDKAQIRQARQQLKEAAQNKFNTETRLAKYEEIADFTQVVLDICERLYEPGCTIPEFISYVIQRTGLDTFYAEESQEENESGPGAVSRVERMATLHESASAFCMRMEEEEPGYQANRSVAEQVCEFIADCRLQSSTSERDLDAKNTVSLMTVHSAKGLEFDHVFVSGMVEQQMPHRRAMLQDGCDPEAELDPDMDPYLSWEGESLAEERRLAYVAMTRAGHGLVLSGFKGTLNPESREMQPAVQSRYLSEVPAELLQRNDLTRKQPVEAAKHQFATRALPPGLQDQPRHPPIILRPSAGAPTSLRSRFRGHSL